MTRVTLRQLEYLVAVVDSGSITAAAATSHVTQATVSMGIAQLEEALKADLLIRTPAKRVAPTRMGLEVASRARRILRQTGDLEQFAHDGSREVIGPLRVACVSSLAPYVIPPLAAHFAEAFAEVDFSYLEGSAVQVQEAVLAGAADLGVIFTRQGTGALAAVKVADVALSVMVSSAHELSEKRAVTFAEVAHESAILIDLPPSRDRSVEFMRAASVEPRIKWTSTNVATVTALVAAGLGYSLVYSIVGENLPAAAGIVQIPVADPLPENSVSVVLPVGLRSLRTADEAVDFLLNHVGPGTRS